MKEEDIKKSFTLEKNLLQVMSQRDTYEYYHRYLREMKLIPTTYTLLRDYDKYFKLYQDHTRIDFDIFLTHFMTEWHQVNMTGEEMSFYADNVIPKLKERPEENYETCLLGLMGRDTLDKINEKEFDLDRIEQLLSDYKRMHSSIVKTTDSDVFSIEDLDLTVVDASGGIPYAFESLQNKLGGMVQGQFIVVGAASGVGKSAFCITQSVDTFRHLNESGSDRPILYFNSEGSPHSLYGRFLSNLYADKLPNGYIDVVRNQDKLKSHFKSTYDTKLFLPFPIRGYGIDYIKSKIERYNPSLVVIDLLDAMSLNNKISEARGFEQLYLDLRDLSAFSCPIIGTSQAGDSAHYWDKERQEKVPKRWLSEKDLYFSNSGKQGAADTLIMIGMDSPYTPPRYISVVKDKVGQGPCKFTCELTPKYSLYEEIK